MSGSWEPQKIIKQKIIHSLNPLNLTLPQHHESYRNWGLLDSSQNYHPSKLPKILQVRISLCFHPRCQE